MQLHYLGEIMMNNIRRVNDKHSIDKNKLCVGGYVGVKLL